MEAPVGSWPWRGRTTAHGQSLTGLEQLGPNVIRRLHLRLLTVCPCRGPATYRLPLSLSPALQHALTRRHRARERQYKAKTISSKRRTVGPAERRVRTRASAV